MAQIYIDGWALPYTFYICLQLCRKRLLQPQHTEITSTIPQSRDQLHNSSDEILNGLSHLWKTAMEGRAAPSALPWKRWPSRSWTSSCLGCACLLDWAATCHGWGWGTTTRRSGYSLLHEVKNDGTK